LQAPRAGEYGPARRGRAGNARQAENRSGWFTVLVRGRTAPQLVWFDTAEGRYLAYRRPGPDGQPWPPAPPADSARIRHQLVELIESVVSI